MKLETLHDSMQTLGIADLITDMWNIVVRDRSQVQFYVWYTLYEGLKRDLKLWNGFSHSH